MDNGISRIIVENIKIPLSGSDEDAFAEAEKRVALCRCFGRVKSSRIYKKSVDARKKDNIFFVVSVTCEAEGRKTPDAEKLRKSGIKFVSDEVPEFVRGSEKTSLRPVVIGFGPAGMFASLYLARYGYRPIVLERGSSVDERVEAVCRFEKNGVLDTENNVQFGAGGAGTFSDGKLTTRIGDRYTHAVLSILREMGAPEDVLTRAKPHIGTDVLRDVVKAFHREIERLGGEIKYNTKVLKVESGKAVCENGEIPCCAAILATGHSARDLYGTIIQSGFAVECKPFSAGVRIEHLQSELDYAMYGRAELAEVLGHAEYSLSHRAGERGVYSFCMCPGGKVVAAASEEGGVVTNGMSNRARDGKNANAAIAVSVLPADFGSDPFKAIAFQRELERAAFEAGGENYFAPTQQLGDFYAGKVGKVSGRIAPSYRDGCVTPCDMNKILPSFITSMLKEGISEFGKKIKGFDAPDVPITGVETRTSAPLRILRGENYEAIGKRNIYPCGEGAGYAGGIVSAAVDGIRTAGAVIERFAPSEN